MRDQQVRVQPDGEADAFGVECAVAGGRDDQRPLVERAHELVLAVDLAEDVGELVAVDLEEVEQAAHDAAERPQAVGRVGGALLAEYLVDLAAQVRPLVAGQPAGSVQHLHRAGARPGDVHAARLAEAEDGARQPFQRLVRRQRVVDRSLGVRARVEGDELPLPARCRVAAVSGQPLAGLPELHQLDQVVLVQRRGGRVAGIRPQHEVQHGEPAALEVGPRGAQQEATCATPLVGAQPRLVVEPRAAERHESSLGAEGHLGRERDRDERPFLRYLDGRRAERRRPDPVGRGIRIRVREDVFFERQQRVRLRPGGSPFRARLEHQMDRDAVVVHRRRPVGTVDERRMLARHESHEVERVVLQSDERASEVEIALQVRYLEHVVELSEEAAHDGCLQRRDRVTVDGERDEHQRPAALTALAERRLHVRDGDAARTECVHDAQAVERRHRVVAGLDPRWIVDLTEHRRELVPGRARVGAEDLDRTLHQAVADACVPPAPVDGDVREQPAAARRVVLRRREADDLVGPAGRRRDDEVQERRRLAAGAPERVAMRLEVLPLLVPREAPLVEAAGRMDRRQQLVAGAVAQVDERKLSRRRDRRRRTALGGAGRVGLMRRGDGRSIILAARGEVKQPAARRPGRRSSRRCETAGRETPRPPRASWSR